MAREGQTAGREYVSQERLLFDTIERLAKSNLGWLGVHLHLSQLRPHNRDESRLRIAFKMFDPLLTAYRSQIFILSNDDIVYLCKDAPPDDLENTVHKIRCLFDKDPLTFADPGAGDDPFCSWYDLSYDYHLFLDVCKKLLADVNAKGSSGGQQAAAPVFDPATLSAILGRLGATDIGPFLRRQSVIGIVDKTYAQVIFQEFFVSIGDLQKQICPAINLGSGRWMFQHLCVALDQAVLRRLETLPLLHKPNGISLNLNIATVFTQSFAKFIANTGDQATVIVEVQPVDVFADINNYFKARDLLHERGHKILLDGLSHLTLQFIEPSQLEPDLIKIVWTPELADFVKSPKGSYLTLEVEKAGPERTILGRCDSESAIKWGLTMGIDMFQGRYIDVMQSAVTMAGCPEAGACTLQQCTTRKGSLAESLRRECGNNDKLDSYPDIKTMLR